MAWDYKELGFRSQEEMEASIRRVKEAKVNPKNDLELRAENKAKFDSVISKNGGIDFQRLEEEARLAALDKAVANKLYWEKDEAKLRAEQEKWDKLMRATSESIAAENKAKAEKMIEEKQTEYQKKLDDEAQAAYGVDSKEERKRSEAWSEMLGGLFSE